MRKGSNLVIVDKLVLCSPIFCVYFTNCVCMLKLGDGKVDCNAKVFHVQSVELLCVCVCFSVWSDCLCGKVVCDGKVWGVTCRI